MNPFFHLSVWILHFLIYQSGDCVQLLPPFIHPKSANHTQKNHHHSSTNSLESQHQDYSNVSPDHLFLKFTSLVLVRCCLQTCFISCDFNCLFRCHLRQIYHSHNPLHRGLRSWGAPFTKPSPHSARYDCQHYHFCSHYYYPASFNNSNYIINSMNLIIGAIFCSKLLYIPLLL